VWLSLHRNHRINLHKFAILIVLAAVDLSENTVLWIQFFSRSQAKKRTHGGGEIMPNKGEGWKLLLTPDWSFKDRCRRLLIAYDLLFSNARTLSSTVSVSFTSSSNSSSCCSSFAGLGVSLCHPHVSIERTYQIYLQLYFFSYYKSANSTLSHSFSAKRNGYEEPGRLTFCLIRSTIRLCIWGPKHPWRRFAELEHPWRIFDLNRQQSLPLLCAILMWLLFLIIKVVS